MAFSTKSAAAVLLLLAVSGLASANADSKSKTDSKKPTISTTSFPDWASAIKAANTPTSDLSILFKAIEAAGLSSSLKATTAWTILAPTNAAFAKRLKALNIKPEALLKDKPTLVKILSYHVIPTPVFSKDLKDGAKVNTLLKGETLTVKLGKGVQFKGANSDAYVKIADIKVGKSVVHVIDDVLLPSDIGAKKTNGGTSAKAEASASAQATTKP